MSFMQGIILVICVVISATSAQSSCYTPTGSRGQCMNMQDCKPIVQLLIKYGRSPPDHVDKFVRDSRCYDRGFGGDVRVCCASTDNSISFSERLTDSGGINQRGLDLLDSLKCGIMSNFRIAGGTPVALGDFPWMALLRYEANTKPFKCGGSLITHRHVITAAHCVVKHQFNIVGVRLGEHDINTDPDCGRKGKRYVCMPPSENYGIEKITAHPDYDSNTYLNDLAIITLDRTVNFNKHIKPICLPITPSSLVIARDQEYFIAGWGTTENGTTSPIPLKAKVPHRDNDYCTQTYRGLEIARQQICVGGGSNIETCTGDSGGPLFFTATYRGTTSRYVQYGVVSLGGGGCGRVTYPGIYTNLKEFIPWITNVIA
ncbi:serine protease grass-like [Teleopsis dalmanni]|uniref:serine protease grass-like n=1 Tax=Teleopsis dalmanni TaxID=139649 RepID=UPI0018CF0949|nr:serine protease grass-like [Teleopsis dalmanni]XP_037947131.1 serine protease grass-like [Teleopsis dalmanni]